MSGLPPPNGSLPPMNIGQSALDCAASSASTTTTTPDVSSLSAAGSSHSGTAAGAGRGELYGSVMIGSLPAMGGGLGNSAPPSPELGPVSCCIPGIFL